MVLFCFGLVSCVHPARRPSVEVQKSILVRALQLPSECKYHCIHHCKLLYMYLPNLTQEYVWSKGKCHGRLSWRRRVGRGPLALGLSTVSGFTRFTFPPAAAAAMLRCVARSWTRSRIVLRRFRVERAASFRCFYTWGHFGSKQKKVYHSLMVFGHSGPGLPITKQSHAENTCSMWGYGRTLSCF